MKISVPAHPFSATAFTSKPLPALAAGYYLATVFANGIPSLSQVALALAPNRGAIVGPLLLLLLDDYGACRWPGSMPMDKNALISVRSARS